MAKFVNGHFRAAVVFRSSPLTFIQPNKAAKRSRGTNESARLQTPDLNSKEGGTCRGKVIYVDANDVFVEVFGRGAGIASHNDFDGVKIDDEFDFVVERFDEETELLLLTRKVPNAPVIQPKSSRPPNKNINPMGLEVTRVVKLPNTTEVPEQQKRQESLRQSTPSEQKVPAAVSSRKRAIPANRVQDVKDAMRKFDREIDVLKTDYRATIAKIFADAERKKRDQAKAQEERNTQGPAVHTPPRPGRSHPTKARDPRVVATTRYFRRYVSERLGYRGRNKCPS